VRPSQEGLTDEADKTLFAAIETETGDGKNLIEGERFVLHLWGPPALPGRP